MTQGFSPGGTSQPAPPPPFKFHLKPTRQPMLWAALAYSSGIIAGTCPLRPPTLWIVAAIAFLVAGFSLLQKRNWIAAALALIALFLSGPGLRRSSFVF